MDSETYADAAGPRRVGAVLAEARAAAGIDLSDIARDTRVPLRHLRAIETDAHDSLPALPYTIGFVKAFARAVGKDPEAAAAQFRAETSKTAHVPVSPTMEPLDERRLPPRGLLTLSIVGVVAILGGVVAYSAGMFDHTTPAESAAVTVAAPASPSGDAAPTGSPPAESPPVGAPAPTTEAPAPANGSADAALAPATTEATASRAAAAAGPGSVVITAREDAWFRVSGFDPAAGKVVAIKTGVLARGERYVVPAMPGLKLWTGRAGALQLSVDGHATPSLGGPAQTVRNVSLDAADVRARLGGGAPAAAASSSAPLPAPATAARSPAPRPFPGRVQ
ncbi:MAG: RodZ domain-containing protein [Janthinobacterium lividum]